MTLSSTIAGARRLAALPLLATVGLLAALAIVPGRAALAVHVYLLVLASLALARLVTGLGRAHPRAASAFDHGLQERHRATRSLPELARLEREVTLATTTAFDVHFRLRPLLRRIAGRTLLARRGVELDRDPALSEQLLGPDLWELVRPEREPPDDRAAPGIAVGALGTMVDSLERL